MHNGWHEFYKEIFKIGKQEMLFFLKHLNVLLFCKITANSKMLFHLTQGETHFSQVKHTTQLSSQLLEYYIVPFFVGSFSVTRTIPKCH